MELTKDDIELITTALHGQYKTEQELYEKDTKDEYAPDNKYYILMNKARDLRNTFGSLINRRYMGQDA
jgi:hypothetical protein